MSQKEKRQFDAYAESYGALHERSIRASGEEPGYFAEYKINYIARVIGPYAVKQRLSILDFGCGVGNSLPHLVRTFPNAELRGVDVSSESLRIARDRNPQVQFSLLSNGSIPFADHSLDLVMAACVYHHIPPQERQAWTGEIRRVLKPGGQMFMFEHNPLNPLTRHAVNHCEFDDDAVLLHRSESRSLLSRSGLGSVSTDYIVFFPKFLSFLRPLERYMGWLPLGAQYVTRAHA